MTLRFHPEVQRDIDEALSYYEERSTIAAERFWTALEARLFEISEAPQRFGFLNATRGLRKVSVPNFPYLILFYESATGVKVTCVKHEKRHPMVGLKRR